MDQDSKDKDLPSFEDNEKEEPKEVPIVEGEDSNTSDMSLNREEQPHEFRRVGANPQIPSSGVYSSTSSGGSKLPLIIIGIVILALIAGAGFFLREKLRQQADSGPAPTPTQTTPIVEETPTPTPDFDRSKYTIRILNGTKTAGLAGSVSAKLKELGYKTERTGNATNSAFTQTVVRAKDSSSDVIAQLIKDLGSEFPAASGSALKANDPADAEIILGK